jgi:hypothetical protein
MTNKEEEEFIVDTAQKLVLGNLCAAGQQTDRINNKAESIRNEIIKIAVKTAIDLAHELKSQMRTN